MKKIFLLLCLFILLLSPSVFAEGQMEDLGNMLLEGAVTGLMQEITPPQLRISISDASSLAVFTRFELLVDDAMFNLKSAYDNLLYKSGSLRTDYLFVSEGYRHTLTYILTHPSQTGVQRESFIEEYYMNPGRKYTFHWNIGLGTYYFSEDF